MKPRKSILDRSFDYTSSVHTDLHKSFARIREQLRANTNQREQQRAQDREQTRAVIAIFESRRK